MNSVRDIYMYMCVKSYQHDPHKVSLTIRKFGLMNLLFPHPHKVELLNVVHRQLSYMECAVTISA